MFEFSIRYIMRNSKRAIRHVSLEIRAEGRPRNSLSQLNFKQCSILENLNEKEKRV